MFNEKTKTADIPVKAFTFVTPAVAGNMVMFADDDKKKGRSEVFDNNTTEANGCGFDDDLRKTFAASEDLQKEFGNEGVASYIAYVKAEKEGLIGSSKQINRTNIDGTKPENELRADFAKSKGLQEEFGTDGVENYLAYIKACSDSLVCVTPNCS